MCTSNKGSRRVAIKHATSTLDDWLSHQGYNMVTMNRKKLRCLQMQTRKYQSCFQSFLYCSNTSELPQTCWVRFHINWRHFCASINKTVASRQRLVATRHPPPTQRGEVWRILFEKEVEFLPEIWCSVETSKYCCVSDLPIYWSPEASCHL